MVDVTKTLNTIDSIIIAKEIRKNKDHKVFAISIPFFDNGDIPLKIINENPNNIKIFGSINQIIKIIIKYVSLLLK